MTNKELGRLERLATAATPGPWERDDRNHVYAAGDDFYIVEATRGARDARFIAAANPQTITALVAEVKRLRALVEKSFREGRDEDMPDHPDVDAAWELSDAKRALDGGAV